MQPTLFDIFSSMLLWNNNFIFLSKFWYWCHLLPKDYWNHHFSHKIWKCQLMKQWNSNVLKIIKDHVWLHSQTWRRKLKILCLAVFFFMTNFISFKLKLNQSWRKIRNKTLKKTMLILISIVGDRSDLKDQISKGLHVSHSDFLCLI